MSSQGELHLKRADELVMVAGELLDGGHPADSVGRSYYAMYHAATAILGALGIQRNSHHALWAAFGEHVAAKGLIDRKFHRYGLTAFGARSSSDYLAEPNETPQVARQILDEAIEFLAAARAFLARE